MSSEEPHYDHLDLRTLIERLPIPYRLPHHAPFPEFKYIDDTRNLTMWRTDTDTVLANEVKGFWRDVMGPPDPPPTPRRPPLPHLPAVG